MAHDDDPITSESAGPRLLDRFSLAERLVHWSLALLMFSCIVTAAVLYNGSLAIAVGHRREVELIHVYSGFALPVPMLAGLGFAAYRADLRRLDRFSPSDWRWLRSRRPRSASIEIGKFNAGQKVNASLSTGAILVLLGTGVIMFFPSWTRLTWRTGATLMHDWFALALGLLVLGHVAFAVKDREALRGMWRGRVSLSWARSEHGAWADEAAPPPDRPPSVPS